MFHTCELTGCGGKTFQLDLEIVWHHVHALCCSWNAMEPGWAKACPEVGEGFKILCDLFVEWAEILLNYNSQHPLCCWIWGIVAQNPFLRGFPAAHTHVASRSRSVIALQRTPSHSTYTHRSSYSTKGIVYQKNRRIQPKTIFFEKMNLKMFFFPSSEVKCSGIW